MRGTGVWSEGDTILCERWGWIDSAFSVKAVLNIVVFFFTPPAREVNLIFEKKNTYKVMHYNYLLALNKTISGLLNVSIFYCWVFVLKKPRGDFCSAYLIEIQRYVVTMCDFITCIHLRTCLSQSEQRMTSDRIMLEYGTFHQLTVLPRGPHYNQRRLINTKLR